MLQKQIHTKILISIFVYLTIYLGNALADIVNSTCTLPLSSQLPIVDGKVTENEYKQAIKLNGAFINLCPWMNKLPKAVIPGQPIVYLSRGEKRLFVAFVNPLQKGEYPRCNVSTRDRAPISTDDVVEVYFQPYTKPNQLLKYYHFMGNARGAYYDAEIIPGIGQTITGWNKDIEFKTSIHSDKWIAELSIPLEDIDIVASNKQAFKMELARNGGSFPKSYCAAFHNAKKHMNVLLDNTAPFVKIQSFGDFEKNLFNPKVEILNTHKSTELIIEFILKANTSKNNTLQPFTYRKTLKIQKNKTVSISTTHKLQNKDKGIASIRIYKSQNDNNPLFERSYPFVAGIKLPPAKIIERKPLTAKTSYAPATGKLQLSVDVFNLNIPPEQLKAYFQVSCYKGLPEKLIVNNFSYGKGSTILDVGLLNEGEYQISCSVLKGKEKIAETSCVFRRKKQSWENNDIGYSDKIPAPWSPLKIKNDSVFCWGRTYDISKQGIPSRILTTNSEATRGVATQQLLAQPIKLLAVVDGKNVRWTKKTMDITNSNNAQVDISANFDGGGLKAKLDGTMEYDGFYKIKLRLTPLPSPVRVDSLCLEIALPNSTARLLHSVGENMRSNHTAIAFSEGKTGVLWDSKSAVLNSSVMGNFLPYVWFGNEDRGIAWMANNDKGWVLDLDKPCLKVIRNATTTKLLIHLANRSTVWSKAVEFEFSLQATPIKPRPKRHDWKGYVKSIGTLHFDKPMISDTIFDIYKKGNRYYRYVLQKGKKDSKGKKQGIGRYLCYATDRIPIGDSFRKVSDDFRGEWAGSYVKSRQDFYLWCIKQWVDRVGLVNIYFDNSFPQATANLLSGIGWIDTQGRKRAGYDMFGMREYSKRVYTYLKQNAPNQPVLKIHITDAACVSYLGFADIWLDGEGLGFPDDAIKNPDFVDRWGSDKALAHIRAIGLGRQYGIMPEFLCLPAKDRKNRYEEMHAILDLHEIDGWGLKPLSKPKDQKGFNYYADDVIFSPYWAEKKLVEVGNENRVLASLWHRPGEARIVVSNLTDKDIETDLMINLKALNFSGNIEIKDEISGKPLLLEGNVIKNIKVPRHKLRRIWLYRACP